MTFAIRIVKVLLFMLAGSAAAEVSQLTVAGDLMIHPDQLASYITSGVEKVNGSPTWDWPELHFTSPYKTAWMGVQAKGPFSLSFTTESIAAQQIGIELDWDNPALTVGQFQIDDTITRTVGATTIRIHLTGQCTGMSMSVPEGKWRMKGHLGWAWGPGGGTNGMQFKWLDFQFSQNNGATAQANLGQCQGPSGLQTAMQQAFDGISKDQTWIENTLKNGVLNWVQSSLAGVHGDLMQPRVFPLKAGLDMNWTPDTLNGLPGGLIRVAGHLNLQKNTAKAYSQTLDRTYTDQSLTQVKESGYVLPKDTMTALMDFLYHTGDLQYRTTSDKVSAFSSLMNSRFMQFFVWPDLMSFASKTVFYFDVLTSGSPALAGGEALVDGGVQYAMQAPLVVHQWAPVSGKYIPYVDFSSQVTGKMQASVDGNQIKLQMLPNQLNVKTNFRGEFSLIRYVNNWIATSLLGSRVQSYLTSTPLTLNVPSWQMSDNTSLSVRDLQQWKQSFRVPLQFKNSK
jgi:hypothetical protein